MDVTEKEHNARDCDGYSAQIFSLSVGDTLECMAHRPLCCLLSLFSLTHLPKSFIQENDPSKLPYRSSRQLTEEGQYVANVKTLVGVAESYGSENGIGTNSRFRLPVDVSISPDGVFALVADQTYHLIRHIVIHSLCDDIRWCCRNAWLCKRNRNLFSLQSSRSLSLYALVTDRDNHLIRHINISTGTVTTLVVGSSMYPEFPQNLIFGCHLILFSLNGIL